MREHADEKQNALHVIEVGIQKLLLSILLSKPDKQDIVL